MLELRSLAECFALGFQLAFAGVASLISRSRLKLLVGLGPLRLLTLGFHLENIELGVLFLVLLFIVGTLVFRSVLFLPTVLLGCVENLAVFRIVGRVGTMLFAKELASRGLIGLGLLTLPLGTLVF